MTSPNQTQAGAQGRSVLVVAAYDSQLKWASSIARALTPRGYTTRVVVPGSTRHALSPQQLRDHGTGPADIVPWSEILTRAYAADVVVLAVHGPLAVNFIHQVADASTKAGRIPPVLVSGWPGVLIERSLAGYQDRSGSDVVAVNSAVDLRTFRAGAAELGLPDDNLLLSGLPLLPARPARPKQGPICTVVWADQPTVPSTWADRTYVVDRLIAYAKTHPDRTVLLKPRHRPGEDTLHHMVHAPEDILRGRTVPSNLSVTYTPVTELLPTTDLLLTVSSTAGLEAVGAGVRTAFVTDLQVREQLGNHVFLGSGLLRSFDEIEKDEIGQPTPVWTADHFFGDDALSPSERIAARADHLVTTGTRPSYAVWASGHFRTQREVLHHRSTVTDTPRPSRGDLLRQGAGRIARAVLPESVVRRLRRG